MKRLIRDEKGYILILALLVLVVVGLISGPVLSYMVSGLRAGHVFETGAAELYAADAGAEEAVWKIQNQVDIPTGCGGDLSRSYNISGVNGKNVDFTITRANNVTQIYRVESTATSNGTGTKIDAYINGTSIYGDFAGITNNVITSKGGITLKPGTEVNPSTGNHSPQADYGGAWPTAGELCDWYFEDVEDEESYGSDIMILNNDTELGPFYRDGELEIKSGTAGITVTLTGTIYISGDTLVGTTGNDFTLDLNGYTIFVESSSADPQKALSIGGHCTLVGEGAIIAVGDIYFQPNTEAGVTDPVFIMSVEGTSLIQPQGDFYGSIAGSVEVDLWPGTSLDYPETGFGVLNFPGCTAGRFIYRIDSWEVSRL
ncbi:MAG: hypothetical protein MUO80_04525 [Dehalococcoidia bacterium]|nr:hypothetical protein [Dehalococcoidia bacterium]